MALLIDIIILGVVQSAAAAIFGAGPTEMGPTNSIVGLVVSAAYYIIAIGQWGTTIGGRVMSLKVVDANGNTPSWGTAAIRWVISLVSAIAILIGYLWAFWDSNRQTWHDKVAGTFVVKP